MPPVHAADHWSRMVRQLYIPRSAGSTWTSPTPSPCASSTPASVSIHSRRFNPASSLPTGITSTGRNARVSQPLPTECLNTLRAAMEDRRTQRTIDVGAGMNTIGAATTLLAKCVIRKRKCRAWPRPLLCVGRAEWPSQQRAGPELQA
eukprot:364100-Chlamydomonas_euryale.AAC.37